MNDDGFFARGRECLSRFPGCRILVAGDVMLDEYIWGTVRRISPEAPVPVVAVTGDTRALGGAANVAVNVASLGAKVVMAGLVGDDPMGRETVRLMKRCRIDAAAVVPDALRPTTVKTRVIAHSQQVVRVDREKREPPGEKAREILRRKILAAIGGVDGIVLSDYRKGVLTRDLVADIVAAARKAKIFVAVDPKQADFSYYRGANLITPNRGEAEAALGGKDLAGDVEIRKAGKVLLRACGADAILITRGEEGMSLVERGRPASFNIPAQARQVFDVTGAGDTVIGTMAVAVVAGASLRDAALLANVAAGVVVGEVGTVPITAAKLDRALRLREGEKEILGKEERGASR